MSSKKQIDVNAAVNWRIECFSYYYIFFLGTSHKVFILMFGRLQPVKSGCVTCVQENLRDSSHLGRTGLPDYRNYL